MLKIFWKPHAIRQLGRWTIKRKEVTRKIDFANLDNCCCGDSSTLKKKAVAHVNSLEKKNYTSHKN